MHLNINAIGLNDRKNASVPDYMTDPFLTLNFLWQFPDNISPQSVISVYCCVDSPFGEIWQFLPRCPLCRMGYCHTRRIPPPLATTPTWSNILNLYFIQTYNPSNKNCLPKVIGRSQDQRFQKNLGNAMT